MSSDITSELTRYQKSIEGEIARQYNISGSFKAKGKDPSLFVESPLALDLADRIAKLIEIPVAERLRELLHVEHKRTEEAALAVAIEVASGKYPLPPGQSIPEAAVRIGLAIVTDGVTVAPIQGVSAVRIKQNQGKDSNYLSVEFAGPIRSAGGTESAFTLVIADQVRKALGLEKYDPHAYGDESGRFVEELRIYERDVGNFQYRVADDDIRTSIENLPVEIDGVWTDNYEVTIHRDMPRISTNKVRGGALRVLNDGVVGKSKKMLKLLNELGVEDWEWLSKLSGGSQQGSEETRASSSHFDEVISGRPVLSMPGRCGGFRLRYGRSLNTGIHAVGVHPSVAAILHYPIVAGTQIKVDFPGKAASIAFVDSLETPLVRLKDGSVVKIKDTEHAALLAPQLDCVLYLGDILISFGDFLENNVKLVPSGYVEEWWVEEFAKSFHARYSNYEFGEEELGIGEERLKELLSNPLHLYPTFREAERISKVIGVPLHPRYLMYWDQITPSDVLKLRSSIALNEKTVRVPKTLKPILETLGIEHANVGENECIVSGEAALALSVCLGFEKEPDKISMSWTNSLELLTYLSGMKIRKKGSTFIGVRVGRPEKAMPRKMRPPVEGLFPVGRSEGMSRDILAASERSATLSLELVNSECPHCEARLVSAKCPTCNVETRLFKICTQCSRENYDSLATSCASCNSPLKASSNVSYPLKQEIRKAALKVEYSPQKPLKGVLGLTNELKIPETLEKVLLRQKYGLSVYRDGTVRYDVTNIPLTHFKPKQIQTNVGKLKQLGYTHDIFGEPFERPDQTLELLMQDVVIPYEAGTFLVSVSKFIDDLLVHCYSSEPYYDLETPEDLLGDLIIGLAPHTSVGIVGRVIGYTNAQACFATPYWHSAKRRDCDGDGDSIILSMDVLLNFSKKFLPSIIGGLMDAPLLIQPSILPKEVQRQAHHMDVPSKYPLEFYEAAERKENPSSISSKMDIIEDRLDDPRRRASDFGFTHDTSSITVKQSRSSYSTLVTLQEKLDRQIELAQKIKAVSADEVVKSVLKTHLLPDIIGNTKAFTAQKFRCKSCDAKYRRMPVQGVCLSCGGVLQPNVNRASVEKYLQLGLRLSQRYDVGEYLRSRFVLAAEELATLFKPEGQQMDMNEYFLTLGSQEALSEKVVVAGKELFAVQTEPPKETKHVKMKQKAPEQYQETLF